MSDGLTRDRIVNELTQIANYREGLTVSDRAAITGATSLLSGIAYDVRDLVLAGVAPLENLLDIIRNADKYALAKTELKNLAEAIAADSKTAVQAAAAAKEDRAAAEAAQRDAAVKLETSRTQYEEMMAKLSTRAEDLEMRASALDQRHMDFDRESQKMKSLLDEQQKAIEAAAAKNESRAAELDADEARIKAIDAEVQERVGLLQKPMTTT